MPGVPSTSGSTRPGPTSRARGSPPGSSPRPACRTPSSRTSAAGHLMARGEVDAVIVGADRIAANGDTANKVGTYTLAVLARPPRHPVLRRRADRPVDLATADGAGIPIEERRADEVLRSAAVRDRAAGHGGPQPLVRRDAGRADHRHRHRGGRRPGAVRDGPCRGGRPARAAPQPTPHPGCAADRGRPERLMAPSRSAAECRASPARRRTAPCSATSSAVTDFTRRTRSATSRNASSGGPAGAPPSTRRAVAVGLEYSGPTPQPLFVMGRDDGIAAVLRDVIKPRAAYIAARAAMLPAIETQYRVDPGPQRSGCGSTTPASGRTGDGPAPAAGRDRRAEPALPAGLRVVARHRLPSPTASTTGCGSTAGSAAAGHALAQPGARAWPSSATS